MTSGEREITGPVDLCLADGRLNPGAVGWSRTPLHRANLRGWGRTKRWEYWCVTTPTHLIALTVGDLDYFRVHAVHFLAYGGYEIERTDVVPPVGGAARLPETIAGAPLLHAAPGATPDALQQDTDVVVGPERPTGGRVRIEIRREEAGTRLRARCVTPERQPLEADLLVAHPEGHETMSVVVPWSPRRFQYTSKHVALPATGQVRVGRDVYAFGDDAWGTLDHGRGRWPRRVGWNWGAAAGRCGGRTVGLQLGGKWTIGTGATENALCVDGRVTKIDQELDWQYSTADFLAPWTVRTPGSDQVDLVFTPFHDRRARTEIGLFANRTDQCFGRYSGSVRTDHGEYVVVDNLLGWAEDVYMRW
ncbi:DUF2804 domain-containing protein [Streptodolium elevatio]|uniref:DUF2804 domain-containing protein n=1 Tax=Streptodolium elevatio TaxID=3157996 RepID=A0ABV3DI23_9ACTN